MSRFRSGTSTTFLIRLLDSETKEQARSPPLRSSKIFKHWQILAAQWISISRLCATSCFHFLTVYSRPWRFLTVYIYIYMYMYMYIPMCESGGRKNAMVMVIICNYLITSSHSSCQSVSQFLDDSDTELALFEELFQVSNSMQLSIVVEKPRQRRWENYVCAITWVYKST